MIFGKTKMEMKVGVFVFIGLIILGLFVLSIGGIKTWSSGYHVDFVFNFVNGVKLGAPVRFAGVDVGIVQGLDFSFPKEPSEGTKVKINCWVKKGVLIPQDSIIWVNTLGLLGEKYVEIIPGKDYANCLTNKQELDGVDPVSMQEVTALASKIAGGIEDIVESVKNKQGTVGKFLYDDDIYNQLDELVKDLRAHPWKLLHRPKGDK